MWMSEAFWRSAWVSSTLIMRITGASLSESSGSSIFGISCTRRERSMSWPMASAT